MQFKMYAEGALRFAYVQERIINVLGDAWFSLLTTQQLLQYVDNMEGNTFRTRWMTNEGMKHWKGTLRKRLPTMDKWRFIDERDVWAQATKHTWHGYLEGESTMSLTNSGLINNGLMINGRFNYFLRFWGQSIN